ncbi:MAG TPA: YdeI/OmpD-associated family protein [Polyangia bacterium]|jgi:uncharacterized protein YdeI (YjbR/CyaY-like superfamily)
MPRTPTALEPSTFAADRAAWRAWLAAHHAAAREVWLVFLKKHLARPCVSYDEAVEEALCFGWIDGVVRRIDDERHAQRFTPRRAASRWSESNRARVRRLTRAGLMAAPGLEAVRAAQASGRWDADERPAGDEVPPALTAALARDRAAQAGWDRLPPSHRRQYVRWIVAARRAETRARRIAATVARVAAGKGAGIDLRIGK